MAGAAGTRRARRSAPGRVMVTNAQWFTDLSWLRARYEVAVDGDVLLHGEVPLPDLAPRASGPLDLPVRMPAVRNGQECYLTLRYVTARATAWAPKGFEVGHDQLLLARKPAVTRARRRAATPAAVHVLGEDPRGVRVGRTTIRFDDLLGVDLRHDDRPLLARGPELAVWRAPIDNDGLKLVPNPWKTLARWGTLGVDALHVRDEHVAAPTAARCRGGAARRPLLGR